ncbi:hypothetical protein K461DRAFT_279053 [Myriangium duriaei CBS 260.36]|uniref:Uncharacterized protein n=1 Tax=Myriangium duriaei CBS 260.36 TaxID=1168546 RepID=A0A9P4IZW3_9PEZI|nr:hypothetical protein K461DRAFT_279053 [Myriangium duriaei CBS 260.36]
MDIQTSVPKEPRSSINGHSFDQAEASSLCDTPSETSWTYGGGHDVRPIDPFWLSVPFISLFSALLIVLASMTGLLFELSRHEDGFSLPHGGHFVWTYGPTAMLTVVASGWEPVVFTCKLFQPWKMLQTEPTQVDRSIRLDYISPTEPITLFRSIRRWHLPVFSTIAVSILLRIATVASTGLLTPITVRTPFEDTNLRLLTQFGAPEAILATNPGTNLTNPAEFSADAVVLDGQSLANGLQTDLVFQAFELPGITLNASTDPKIRANVDVFRPLTVCEPANISLSLNNTNPNWEYTMSASWPSCPQSNSVKTLLTGASSKPTSLQELWGLVQRLVCPNSSHDPWVLTSIFDVRWNQSTIPDALFQANTSENAHFQFANATSVACSFGYSMGTAQVTYNLASNPATLASIDQYVEAPGKFVPGFTVQNFSRAMLIPTSNILNLSASYTASSSELKLSILPLMTAMHNTTYQELFYNLSALTSAAETALNYVGVQTAAYYVVQNSTSSVIGQISTLTPKIQVPAAIPWVMIAVLLTAAMLALLLVFTRPRLTIPWSLGNISSVALALLQHPVLAQSKFICPKSITVGKNDSQTDDEDSSRWWRPVIMRPSSLVLVALLFISMLAVLEVLQHISDREEGLAVVHNVTSTLTSITTRWVPSLILLSASLLYNSIKFNVLLFTPFNHLKEGHSGFATMKNSILGKVLPVAVYRALQGRHWAATVIILISVMANFLTVFVSGLYHFENAPALSTIVLQRLDDWDPLWIGSTDDFTGDDGGSALLLGELVATNGTYPAFTSADLAVPKFDLSQDTMDMIGSSRSHNLTITTATAVGDLNCTVMPVTDDQVVSSDEGVAVYGTANLPPHCLNGTKVKWVQSFSSSVNDTAPFDWVGKMSRLANPNGQDQMPLGCPTLTFTFGQWNDQKKHFTNLLCSQYMTKVETNVTLSVPEMTVLDAVQDQSKLLYLDTWNTAYPVYNSTAVQATAKSYNVDYFFTDTQLEYPPCMQQIAHLTGSFSNYFGLLMCPMQGEPLLGESDHNSADPSSVDRTVDAITALYRRYMAQVANKKMRRVSASDERSNIPAWWHNPSRAIVRQDRVSKTIIQIILGVMAVSIVMVYFHVNTKDILPYNPCSIAGVASLLVDSEICKAVPDEDSLDVSVWLTRIQQLWSGKEFAMGWWSGRNHDKDGIAWQYGIDFVDGQGGKIFSPYRPE